MKKVRIPEPTGFAEFWSIWLPHARHTDGRGLARETFRRHLLNGAMPEDIIDGARWFLRSMTDRDRQYVPLSSTWLNREAYIDLCEKERAYQARLNERPAENVVSIKPQLGQTAFLREFERRKASGE